MTTFKKIKVHQKPRTQPRAPRPSYPTEQAVNRIISILRPLTAEERTRVLRSVGAYYQEGG